MRAGHRGDGSFTATVAKGDYSVRSADLTLQKAGALLRLVVRRPPPPLFPPPPPPFPELPRTPWVLRAGDAPQFYTCVVCTMSKCLCT
eukprot:COSAG01_NODE_7711_length_3089_cov_3.476589_3_plen_88_part_00